MSLNQNQAIRENFKPALILKLCTLSEGYILLNVWKFEIRILNVEYIMISTISSIFYDGSSDLITSDKSIINLFWL